MHGAKVKIHGVTFKKPFSMKVNLTHRHFDVTVLPEWQEAAYPKWLSN